MVDQDDIANANATYHGFMRGIKVIGIVTAIITAIVVLLIATNAGPPPAG